MYSNVQKNIKKNKKFFVLILHHFNAFSAAVFYAESEYSIYFEIQIWFFI